MQASAFFLLACCLQVGAATYSQQMVSYTGKDVPLKTVFAHVKKETGYGFFYENGEEATLSGSGKVTLDLKNVPLDMFLKIVLKDQPLDYSLEGTTIFIKKKEKNEGQLDRIKPSDSIPLLKGRVVTDKGEPLSNANVVIKRTKRGTVTDANGQFILKNTYPEDILLISFIGYKTQTFQLHNSRNVSVDHDNRKRRS